MPRPVKPIPDGYHTITPYLSIKGAVGAIDFYKKAFGATEVMRVAQPDGRVGHAELQLGDSRIMLADESPERDFRSPPSIGGSPVHLHMYVANVDAVVSRAVAAGAKIVRPVQRCRTSSTATGWAPWPIRMATCGTCRRTRKTCRSTSCASAPRPSTRASATRAAWRD